MAGNAFNNLNKIFLSDTFRAWFDKTNEIISTINPLEIYGITNEQGEYAGITYTVGTDGIVTIGLDLPNSLTGDFTFVRGVTFAGFVNVSGSTVDFGGATLQGRVVRTINGQTGDVVLSTVATPGTAVTGDILVYNAGGTYEGYNLFSDGTAENRNPFHIGGSGGIFVGITSGGSSAGSFIKQGVVQLVGATSSAIYMVDNTNPLTDSQIAGAEIRYGNQGGSHILKIGGRNKSGTFYGTPNFVVDFDEQSIAVGGQVTGPASINIGDASGNGKPILYTDTNGSTFSVRYLTAKESSGRTSGGFTGLAAFGGNPASKGLLDDQRVRLEYTAGSVEVEITGSGSTSGFVVYGKETPYGNLLLPTLVARRDGNVVIGGISPQDGGTTGTTFGGLNIASGKLLVGGTAGAAISSGYQVLSSNGVTCGWRVLNSTATSFDGTVAIPSYAIQNTSTYDITISTSDSSIIQATDNNNQTVTGPFSATISMPQMILFGSPNANENGVIGVRMTIDSQTVDKYITWSELYNQGSGVGKIVSPTFTFTGNATTKLYFTPFATNGDINSTSEVFGYCGVGSYLITFNKLG